MRIERMVGQEVTWYFTAVLDLFGSPAVWRFCTPRGKNKIR